MAFSPNNYRLPLPTDPRIVAHSALPEAERDPIVDYYRAPAKLAIETSVFVRGDLEVPFSLVRLHDIEASGNTPRAAAESMIACLRSIADEIARNLASLPAE